MDSLKINEDVCRICLKETTKLHWNNIMQDFCEISYKDCYYKYTQLEELDSHCYPTSLCEMCANELENAHLLFEKALESFYFLQAVLRSKQLEMKCEVLVSIEVDNTLIEDQICLSPVCDSEKKAETEDEFSDSDEMVVEENLTVQPTHFMDINDLEAFDETSYDQHLSKLQKLSESLDAKLSKSALVVKKSRRHESLTKTSLKQQHNKRYNTELPHTLATKNTDNKIKNAESLAQTSSLQQKLGESAETKPAKLEESYLICAYCSLKVKARNLAGHEATHSENRKRTETCTQCGVQLYNKLTLRLHMKIHDKNRQKNYKCEFCGNGFYNRGALNIHRRKHLGLTVKCKLCTKEFVRQVDLDRHLVKHSGSLQRFKNKYVVQCQYCNKQVVTVKWEGHLAAHLNQPQVKCKICDKNFFSRQSCTYHLRRFHHKKSSEYENYMHYYADRKKRVSILMMKQKFNAQPRTENV